MAWITPFVNWIVGNIPTATDFNRIEGNEVYLKERADVVDAFIDQDVKAAASPTFGNANVIGNITTATITATGNTTTNGTATFNGNQLPTSTPTSGTWSTTQVVPKGRYTYGRGVGSGTISVVQSGVLVSLERGVILSDGINTTITMPAGHTVLFFKF